MLARCAGAILVCISLGAPAFSAEPEFDAAALEFFEKQVRPILANRCYECHSKDAKRLEGSLKLDSRAAVLKGGDTDAAIVPGKPKESLLIDAINYGETYQMPPKSKLPAEEIATLTKWVEMGAPWPKEEPAAADASKVFDLAARKASHWSWQPIREQPLPPVKNAAWVKQPLDAFILAKLEEKGIAPNGPAEKRILIRRAYFDLIGLPPSPAQVEAFVKDESPQAFEKVIDELLASQHFGERWGRHWLDLVRYAESRGHEFDPDIPNAWQYRDYVIRALNADVPYDQFVVEHIAGDLVEQPRLHPEEKYNESVLGTGFWHLGEWIHSPVDIRKDECDRFDNMVDVFSKTFLAMTVSCARCHDHKFDAISQQDYYALLGYLQSSEYRQARFDTELEHREIAEKLAKLDESTQNEVLAAYRDATKETIEQLPKYWAAARKLLLAEGREIKPESVKAVATETKLDGELLQRWIDYLLKASGEKDDMLQPLAALLAQPAPADDKAWEKQIAPWVEDATARQAAEKAARDKAKIIVDYNDEQYDDFLADGVAFGLRPVRAGEVVLRNDGQTPLVVDVVRSSMARRDPRFKGLTRAAGTQPESANLGKFEAPGQTLRTPVFEVTADKVCYLVQGAGRAFAVVDSHRMIAGPLHGQTATEWDNAAGARWITHNLGMYKGHRVHIEFSPRGDEDLRVLMVVCGETVPEPYVSPGLLFGFKLFGKRLTLDELPQVYVEILQAASEASPWEQRDAELARFRAWLVEHTDLVTAPAQYEALQAKLKAISEKYQRENDALVKQIKRPSRTAPALWDGSGEDERLLVRGNATTPKDLVPRKFLTAIGGETAPKYQGSGRLQLAQQVVAADNPLTARVMANRVWHHLLGRGIVPTTDNFGVLGQAPTHPELLDHLAMEFRREGWSVKRLIKTVMLSSTYQMSSAPSDADKELDPQNLLWHRGHIQRLEGEVIRDQMLVLSGRFNDKMYGPSVPVFLTPYMQGRGRPGASGPLDGDGRRSIYIAIRRNFLSPMMLAFDTPSPFSTMGKRNVSNVPAQALMLMNDPFVLDQAKLWAKRLLADGSLSTADARISRLYEQAFARAPSADELATARAFLDQQAAEYKLSPDAAARDERVWTDLCHVLMNVKEFIFVP